MRLHMAPEEFRLTSPPETTAVGGTTTICKCPCGASWSWSKIRPCHCRGVSEAQRCPHLLSRRHRTGEEEVQTSGRSSLPSRERALTQLPGNVPEQTRRAGSNNQSGHTQDHGARGAEAEVRQRGGFRSKESHVVIAAARRTGPFTKLVTDGRAGGRRRGCGKKSRRKEREGKVDLALEAQAGKQALGCPHPARPLWVRQAGPLGDWTKAPLMPSKWVLMSQGRAWPLFSP